MSDPEPIGYYLDRKDGEGDLYVCRGCVKQHDKSKDNPVDEEAFAILPMACGIHAYYADPDEYV